MKSQNWTWPKHESITAGGRNGTFICGGLFVMEMGQSVGSKRRLSLMGLTSRNTVGSGCNIDVPKDPEILRDLAGYLLEAATEAELEARAATTSAET